MSTHPKRGYASATMGHDRLHVEPMEQVTMRFRGVLLTEGPTTVEQVSRVVALE